MKLPAYLIPFISFAIPLAVTWTTKHEKIILASGVPLSPQQIDIATRVGVRHPERVRILLTDLMPEPEPVLLAQLAREVNYVGSNADGITFGYGVYIMRRCASDNHLLAHELTHVAQHERLGGIEPFVRQYCNELVNVGYDEALLEVEARQKAKPWERP